MATTAPPSTALGSREIDPAVEARLRPGDRVRWNGYVGQIRAVNGATAVVLEPDNKLFGRPITWRLPLDALSRVE